MYDINDFSFAVDGHFAIQAVRHKLSCQASSRHCRHTIAARAKLPLSELAKNPKIICRQSEPRRDNVTFRPGTGHEAERCFAAPVLHNKWLDCVDFCRFPPIRVPATDSLMILIRQKAARQCPWKVLPRPFSAQRTAGGALAHSLQTCSLCTAMYRYVQTYM